MGVPLGYVFAAMVGGSTFAFPLVHQSGEDLEWDRSPDAECTAELVCRSGQAAIIETIAMVGFHTSAASR